MGAASSASAPPHVASLPGGGGDGDSIVLALPDGGSLNVVPAAGRHVVTGLGKGGPLATFRVQRAQPPAPAGAWHLIAWNGWPVVLVPAAGGAAGTPLLAMPPPSTPTAFMPVPVPVPVPVPAPASAGSAGGAIVLQALTAEGMVAGYVAVGPPPHRVAGMAATADGGTRFTVRRAALSHSDAGAAAQRMIAGARGDLTGGMAGRGAVSLPPAPPASMTAAMRAALLRDGYVVCGGVVPPLLVAAAMRQVNSMIGAVLIAAAAAAAEQATAPVGGVTAVAAAAGAGAGGATASTPAPALPTLAASGDITHSSHPALLALYASTAAAGLVASAMGGAGNVAPVGGCQVAPRYPRPLPPEYAVEAAQLGMALWSSGGTAGDPVAPESGAAGGGGSPHWASLSTLSESRDQGRDDRWHIDGMDKQRAAPFTLLVGVALSDTEEGDMGQLTVYPGSHTVLSDFMARNGEAALVGAGAPRPPLGVRPVQLRMRAGDIVIAHALTAHRVGFNFSPAIRYACFFRCTHARHEELRPRVVAGDTWAELPAIAAAATAPPAPTAAYAGMAGVTVAEMPRR
jgi:hypothetical protein